MLKECDHKSVGMLVRKNQKLLLIERVSFPFGFAPPAGHVDSDSDFAKAARRELREEVGLVTERLQLIAEGRKENQCKRPGGDWHYWKIFEVEATGEIQPSLVETRQAGWFKIDDVRKLAKKTEAYLGKKINEEEWKKSPGLETVWHEWFQELGII